MEETIMLFRLVLCFGLSALEATTLANAKPDLQKVYNEALSWSKDKLLEMPNAQQSAATISPSKTGICRGQKDDSGELAITSGCKKKSQNHGMEEDYSNNRIKTPTILVFVSFSMPKASLTALSKEAERFGAVLVMRGLKGDSFKDTQAAFQALGEEERSGIEINPELFETYKIQQVPVFIKVKTAPEGDLQEIGRLCGNVSLVFATQKLEEVA